MVRKGLSADEKKRKLLQIYHTTKEVLNLKELEKLGANAGVVSNTIKDINQELVCDGVVDSDKIGSSNFFWSFPIKALAAQVNQVGTLKKELQAAEELLEEAKQKGEALRSTRVENDERSSKLRRLNDERERQARLNDEAEKLKENDPKELEKIEEMMEAVKAGVNLWTDNTWAIKAYMVKKQGFSGKEVDKMLGLKEDFDYV